MLLAYFQGPLESPHSIKTVINSIKRAASRNAQRSQGRSCELQTSFFIVQHPSPNVFYDFRHHLVRAEKFL